MVQLDNQWGDFESMADVLDDTMDAYKGKLALRGIHHPLQARGQPAERPHADYRQIAATARARRAGRQPKRQGQQQPQQQQQQEEQQEDVQPDDQHQ